MLVRRFKWWPFRSGYRPGLGSALEFGERCRRILEETGVALPVDHLAGGELPDDDRPLGLDEQDGADLDDRAAALV
jgi:hypothetical protein